MFSKRSRYEQARKFSNEDGRIEDFDGVRPREIGPADGVIEHTVIEGERIESIALTYYNDPRKWWRILDANPNVLYGGELFERHLEGVVILIPRVTEPGGKR